MRQLHQLAVLIAALVPSLAYGHGSPIKVNGASGQLVVTGGTLDPSGFANRLFLQTGADGDAKGIASFDTFGSSIYWDVPGFEITNMTENSGLFLEALARPVSGAEPSEHRVLWYWNPDSGEVDEAPTEKFRIRKSATQYIHLTPDTSETPPPVLVAAPVSADMNNHNHTLLKFLLPNPPPEGGVYAFFARLTSNVYEPSEPFLVLINHDFVGDAELLEGGLAINAAAVASLPGDYNNDLVVDAADYTVWRNNFGNPSEAIIHNNGDGHGGVDEGDYTWWRRHYGTMSAGGGGLSAAVPEPHGILLAMIAFFAVLMLTAGRNQGIVPRFSHESSTEPRRPYGKISSTSMSTHASGAARFAMRVHARRATRRDRDHRRAHRLDAAGRSAGTRIGAQIAVWQQSQADRPGDSQLSGRGEIVSAGLRLKAD
jgi:hypothetical protein